VKKLEKRIARATKKQRAAQATADAEASALALVREHIGLRKAEALDELRSYFSSPPATMHVLKAVFRLLKRDEAASATWASALRLLDSSFFDDVEGMDATLSIDQAVWKSARAAFQAVEQRSAEDKWIYECPKTAIGAFLMNFIKQARVQIFMARRSRCIKLMFLLTVTAPLRFSLQGHLVAWISFRGGARPLNPILIAQGH
jgi:hypothetical protein